MQRAVGSWSKLRAALYPPASTVLWEGSAAPSVPTTTNAGAQNAALVVSPVGAIALSRHPLPEDVLGRNVMRVCEQVWR